MASKWMMIVFCMSPCLYFKGNQEYPSFKMKKKGKQKRIKFNITGDTYSPVGGEATVIAGAGHWSSSGSCTVPLRIRSGKSTLNW